MNLQKLNEWAAKYMGEEGAEQGFSVDSEIYTTSIGAALSVLAAMIEEGHTVELEAQPGDEGFEVKVSGFEREGDWASAPRLIIEACYACISNESDDDDDDT